MIDSLLHPSAPVRFGFTSVAHLMRYAGLPADTILCFALSTRAEVISDSVDLDLSDVKVINNQPVSKPTRGTVHNECVKSSLDHRDNDNVQVEEYHLQKGQASNIHTKSGMDMPYNLNKPEDNLPHIRECGGINRAPLVNILGS